MLSGRIWYQITNYQIKSHFFSESKFKREGVKRVEYVSQSYHLSHAGKAKKSLCLKRCFTKNFGRKRYDLNDKYPQTLCI